MRWLIKGDLNNKYYRNRKGVNTLPYQSELERLLENALEVAIPGNVAIKRGDRPGLPFGEIADPEAAYETAVVTALVAAEFIKLNRGLPAKIKRIETGIYEIDYWYGHISGAFDRLHMLAVAAKSDPVVIGTYEFACEPIVFQVDFNDVIMRVDASSNKQAFVRDYMRALGERIPQPVGPHYNLELTQEERAVEDAYQAKLRRPERERVEARASNVRMNRAAGAAGREFDLLDVLAVTTSISMKSDLHMRGVMEFMCGEGLERMGLVVMADRCREALIEQYSWLADAKPPENFTLDQLEEWCEDQVAEHGEKILVKPLPADEPPV